MALIGRESVEGRGIDCCALFSRTEAYHTQEAWTAQLMIIRMEIGEHSSYLPTVCSYEHNNDIDSVCRKLFIECAVFVARTKQVGTDSVSASHMDKTMRYVMRAMPIIILPFIAKFPAVCTCCAVFIHSFLT